MSHGCSLKKLNTDVDMVFSRLVKQLKARGEAGGKGAIRDYTHVKGAKVEELAT